jgi:hypothetical protein
MPHRSNAELTVASLMPGLRRLNRPPDLGGVEAAIFRRTVAAVPASHFAAEDMVLLCACAAYSGRCRLLNLGPSSVA